MIIPQYLQAEEQHIGLLAKGQDLRENSILTTHKCLATKHPLSLSNFSKAECFMLPQSQWSSHVTCIKLGIENPRIEAMWLYLMVVNEYNVIWIWYNTNMSTIMKNRCWHYCGVIVHQMFALGEIFGFSLVQTLPKSLRTGERLSYNVHISYYESHCSSSTVILSVPRLAEYFLRALRIAPSSPMTIWVVVIFFPQRHSISISSYLLYDLLYTSVGSRTGLPFLGTQSIMYTSFIYWG